MRLPDFLTRDRYGEIRLKGHRIGLFHIVFFHNRGESVEAILSRFPSLPPELVNAVITFYETNKDEVDAYVAACQAEINQQRDDSRRAWPLGTEKKTQGNGAGILRDDLASRIPAR